ncbi:hypothetical protein [Tenacibaculum ovolyticum]|uniref:hypothetical protein n=1 Tax=Tenacibaculum ovolyticum TaxID=104270 RepID=UPI0003FC8F6B|nr:hypothetical protein [Tenacibaculum ovolyticum]
MKKIAVSLIVIVALLSCKKDNPLNKTETSAKVKKVEKINNILFFKHFDKTVNNQKHFVSQNNSEKPESLKMIDKEFDTKSLSTPLKLLLKEINNSENNYYFYGKKSLSTSITAYIIIKEQGDSFLSYDVILYNDSEEEYISDFSITSLEGDAGVSLALESWFVDVDKDGFLDIISNSCLSVIETEINDNFDPENAIELNGRQINVRDLETKIFLVKDSSLITTDISVVKEKLNLASKYCPLIINK